MNETPSKFTLKYSYDGSEDYSPMDVTFDIPGDSTIDQMLFNFECFLKACGFVFDTKFVQSNDDEYDLPEEEQEEAEYGCVPDWDGYLKAYNEKIENNKKLKEWNEGIAKLDNELKEQREIREKAYKSAEMCAEVAKNKWVHGICNPPSPDWKKS